MIRRLLDLLQRALSADRVREATRVEQRCEFSRPSHFAFVEAARQWEGQ